MPRQIACVLPLYRRSPRIGSCTSIRDVTTGHRTAAAASFHRQYESAGIRGVSTAHPVASALRQYLTSLASLPAYANSTGLGISGA
eukprot:1368615-Rhodomonas_salina.2